MKYKTINLRRASHPLASLLSCASMFATPLWAAQYTVADLGGCSPPCQSIIATGLNDQGSVTIVASQVGALPIQVISLDPFGAPVNLFETGFLSAGGQTMQAIGKPGNWNHVGPINAVGQVAGYWYSPTGIPTGYLYSNGGLSELGRLPGGAQSLVRSINVQGQLVGWARAANGIIHAFSYDNGVMIDLVGAAIPRSSDATSVNNSGQIAGYFTTTTNARHAFRYSDGAMTDLGTLGGSDSIGAKINGAGQVTGWSHALINNVNTPHAFIADSGQPPTMHDLTPRETGYSAAVDINEAGQIVGWVGNGPHAFLYDNGTTTDLGTFVGGLKALLGPSTIPVRLRASPPLLEVRSMPFFILMANCSI